MKVKFADLVVRVREIEFPEVCPRCGTDLTVEGSLFSFRLEQVAYVVGLRSLKDPKDNDFATPEDSYPVVRPVTAVTYLSCRECATEPGSALMSGEEKVLQPDPAELERLQQETVWTQSVDQLIFGGNNF